MRLRNGFLLLIIAFVASPLYGQDKTTSKEHFDAKFTFRIGSEIFDPTYNATSLTAFMGKLNELLADSNYVVNELRIIGATSPDGKSEKINIDLARKRAESIQQYISSNVNLPYSAIKVENNGENWPALRIMMAASSMPYKREALQIVDNIYYSRNERKNKLTLLRGGAPYKYMSTQFFPLLRGVIAEVDYSRRPQKVSPPIAVKVVPVRVDTVKVKTDTVKVNTEKPEVVIKPSKIRDGFTPYVAIKTNLLYWAGITPDFEWRKYAQKLEMECFFAQRWSFNVSGSYTSTKKKSGDEVSAFSSIAAEPRFWIEKDSRFSGLYVGVYGLYGDFTASGYTGEFCEGGVSMGFYLNVFSRVGLELGAQVGYHSSSCDNYSVEDSHFYEQSSFTDDKIKVTGIRLMLTYRIGKTVKKKSNEK